MFAATRRSLSRLAQLHRAFEVAGDGLRDAALGHGDAVESICRYSATGSASFQFRTTAGGISARRLAAPRFHQTLRNLSQTRGTKTVREVVDFSGQRCRKPIGFGCAPTVTPIVPGALEFGTASFADNVPLGRPRIVRHGAHGEWLHCSFDLLNKYVSMIQPLRPLASARMRSMSCMSSRRLPATRISSSVPI
jgi:hypothetical protein